MADILNPNGTQQTQATPQSDAQRQALLNAMAGLQKNQAPAQTQGAAVANGLASALNGYLQGTQLKKLNGLGSAGTGAQTGTLMSGNPMANMA